MESGSPPSLPRSRRVDARVRRVRRGLSAGVLLAVGAVVLVIRSRSLPRPAWMALAAFSLLAILVLVGWRRSDTDTLDQTPDPRLSVLRAQALSRGRVIDVPSSARLLVVSHLEARQLLRQAVRLRWAEVVETHTGDVAYRFHTDKPRDRLVPRP